jgi:hypothetical protein
VGDALQVLAEPPSRGRQNGRSRPDHGAAHSGRLQHHADQHHGMRQPLSTTLTTAPRAVSLLEPLKSVAADIGKEMVLHVKPKSEDGAKECKALLEAAQASGSPAALGTLKDKHEGESQRWGPLHPWSAAQPARSQHAAGCAALRGLAGSGAERACALRLCRPQASSTRCGPRSWTPQGWPPPTCRPAWPTCCPARTRPRCSTSRRPPT